MMMQFRILLTSQQLHHAHNQTLPMMMQFRILLTSQHHAHNQNLYQVGIYNYLCPL